MEVEICPVKNSHTNLVIDCNEYMTNAKGHSILCQYRQRKHLKLSPFTGTEKEREAGYMFCSPPLVYYPECIGGSVVEFLPASYHTAKICLPVTQLKANNASSQAKTKMLYHYNSLHRRPKGEGVADSCPSCYMQNRWTTESFSTHLSLNLPVAVTLIVLWETMGLNN